MGIYTQHLIQGNPKTRFNPEKAKITPWGLRFARPCKAPTETD